MVNDCLRCDFNNTITVVVTNDVNGANSAKFNVHRDVFVSQSAPFNVMLTPPWSGDDPNLLMLSDDDPATFRILVHWMYFDCILLQYPLLEATASPDVSEETLDMTGHSLCSLWILADKYGISRAKDHVTDALIELWQLNDGFNPSLLIKYVYENTVDYLSQLRRVLVAMHTHLKSEAFRARRDYLCQDFLLEFGVASLKGFQHPWTSFCDFHSHDRRESNCLSLKRMVYQLETADTIASKKGSISFQRCGH